MTITFGLGWDDYANDQPDDDHEEFPSDLQEEPDEQPEA